MNMLRSWDVSNLTDMSGMFSGLSIFKQEILGCTSLTEMSGLFMKHLISTKTTALMKMVR
jgi:hypothetical protein